MRVFILAKLYNGDCLDVMKQLPSNYYDVLLVDPPYEYLDHKLDKSFNEQAVFDQWNRILKDTGYIIMFGRGISFYRWNVMLDQLGWKFKEEVIWDKMRTTSPVLPLMRVHETISILAKNGKGKINKTCVPYTDSRLTPEVVLGDIKRLESGLNQDNKAYGELLHYLETHDTTIAKKSVTKDMLTFTPSKNFRSTSRIAATAKSMLNGKRETDIMSMTSPARSHRYHPTQKPTKLLERLLKLVAANDNIKVIDTFMGSGSTGVACADLNNKENKHYEFTGIELDSEYFKIAKERIEETEKNNDKYL